MKQAEIGAAKCAFQAFSIFDDVYHRVPQINIAKTG